MTTPDPSSTSRVILDAEEIARATTRLAHEVLETNRGTDQLVLLGIQTRGVPLARRLAEAIEKVEGISVPVGVLDTTMYRDDLRNQPTRPVGRTELPTAVDGMRVVLVDDVLASGRTVLSALDALKDLGRPSSVRLVVLVDRGQRELPIRADHTGLEVGTRKDERVRVHLTEVDGRDEVVIEQNGAPR